MSSVTVPFYFGLGSRYSYLASTQLDRLEQELDCRFKWLPLASGTLMKLANDGRYPFHQETPVSGQYNWSFREKDAKAWADYYGIPFVEPVSFRTDPADLAKTCWFAGRSGLLKPMSKRIMQAIFVESRIVTRELLAEMAKEVGLEDSNLIEALDSHDLDNQHEQLLQRALADDVFGVPTFLVNGNLFWGNDRLPLVVHAIRKNQPSPD